jgi:hypothetical protein
VLKVEPGQYWIPNDRSQSGRIVKVNRIEGKYAHCTTRWKGKAPSEVKILLTRFAPTATGFRRIPAPERAAA